MNEVLKLNLNDSTVIKFQVEIEGANAQISGVEFSIVSDSMRLTYVSTYTDGSAVFTIQNLGKFLNPGVYPCDLKVYVGGQFFTPFIGQVELLKPISVHAEPIVEKSTPKGETVITATPKVIVKSLPEIGRPFKPKDSKPKLKKSFKLETLEDAWRRRHKKFHARD